MSTHKDTTIIVKVQHSEGPYGAVADYVFRLPEVSGDEYAVVPHYDGDGWIVIHIGTGVAVFNHRAYERSIHAMQYAMEILSAKGKDAIISRLAELPRLENAKQVLTHPNKAQA